MRRTLLSLFLPLVALLGAGLASASAAHASSSVQFSIMMDDDLLLYRGDDTRDATLQRMLELGVDYVRVTVLWRNVAHNAKFDRRGRKRAKFRPGKPGTYPKYNWDPYDRLVRAGRTLGIGIYFNVTGPGPKWAHGKPPRSQRRYASTWEPDAKAFGKFVQAVGRRYDGTYRDENDSNQLLPRVSFWSIYNEPNQQGWLTPQWRGSIPWAPVMYRELWLAGREGLDRSGHDGDVVLIGETAPLGSTNRNPPSPLYPKRFIREFFCLDSNYRRYTGASARRRQCSTLGDIGEFRQAAWAHHPYTKELAPTRRDSNRDSITMANIGELPAILDRVASTRSALPEENHVALTEFGYETNPPDRFSGVAPAQQAEWLNLGDYMAYKEDRVIANTQFLLRDGRGIKKYRKGDKRHWFRYQSGLYRANGRPKPAAIAYRMPLVVTERDADSTSFWGWIRFLPQGIQTEVSMQFKAAGTRDFQTVGGPVPVTNPLGFFETTQPNASPGTWRAVFTERISGTTIASREVRVG